MGKTHAMQISKADSRCRLTLRQVKPGQAFSVHPHPNGSITLLPVAKVGRVTLQNRCALRLQLRQLWREALQAAREEKT